MLRPAVTQLISKNDSYYSLVIGVAKRAREIANELVEEKKTLEEKPVKTAVEELASGKYKIVEASEEEKDEPKGQPEMSAIHDMPFSNKVQETSVKNEIDF